MTFASSLGWMLTPAEVQPTVRLAVGFVADGSEEAREEQEPDRNAEPDPCTARSVR